MNDKKELGKFFAKYTPDLSCEGREELLMILVKVRQAERKHKPDCDDCLVHEENEKLQSENAGLRAEVHKWVEAAKGLNRENIACIQMNGKLQARWEKLITGNGIKRFILTNGTLAGKKLKKPIIIWGFYEKGFKELEEKKAMK